MPPAAVLINTSPDLNFGATPVAAPPSSGSGKRTLLLAPPSIASREDRLTSLFAIYPRSSTDLQMLDRLAAGLVNLPEATYDLILVVTDPNGGRRSEAAAYLASRAVWAKLLPALKAGATLRSEDGSLGQGSSTEEKEAVLAGLMVKGDGDGFTKVEYEEEAVPLRFGLKKKTATGPASEPAAPTSAAVQKPVTATPAGVGFIDFSDDLDLDLDAEEDDDDLVDEDMLLTEADMRRPIQQPPECAPQPGKKRRACKDCTCGLAERLQAEDKARQEKAENARNTLKLKSEDLSELDFTVKGKTGSCNGCYLGDAFRCEGCPYIGLPAFKPGEEVTILKGLSQI